MKTTVVKVDKDRSINLKFVTLIISLLIIITLTYLSLQKSSTSVSGFSNSFSLKSIAWRLQYRTLKKTASWIVVLLLYRHSKLVWLQTTVDSFALGFVIHIYSLSNSQQNEYLSILSCKGCIYNEINSSRTSNGLVKICIDCRTS